VVNVLTSLVGNVFGFKALRALRLEDIRFPIAYVMTCNGPPQGIQVERDILNKYGVHYWVVLLSLSWVCLRKTMVVLVTKACAVVLTSQKMMRT